ncbi:hypothetical protein CVT24_003776 [Panaeolus cyanescens]|uniref:Uncharacterized protein n=1 Tax=Panaeolus cyanescens TaxID=181874 RepID=A0A409VUS1_9AGAR|nr:hypothetical protein CVT24_003776 [Panaeolus cyanescens]
MTSFRNHRIVIASLFLPTTAVIGEPDSHTPDYPAITPADLTLPAVSQRLAATVNSNPAGALSDKPRLNKPPKPTIITNTAHNAHTRSSSASGPFKSIVDDLKDKSRFATPSTRSPTNEASNPFQKLTRFALDAEESEKSSSLANTTGTGALRATSKHQSSDSLSTPRVRRKQSRSSSRRAPSATPISPRRSPADPDSPAQDHGVVWHMEPNPHCNGGLKNAVDSVGDRMKKKLWVGTLGTPTDGFSDDLKADIDDRMLREKQSMPVWIPDKEFSSAYDEFCHQVLWPCLHYAVPDAPKTKLFYESASFKQYVAVNQRFADRIIASYREGDVIWVNDYHLLLLPTLLRLSPHIPSSAPIGFFMHVAFPSSEIFRCLAVRKELLRGVLGADFVGFQTVGYARHFRQTVSRIMSFEALPRGIQIPEGEGLTLGEMRASFKGDVISEAEREREQRARDGLGERGRFVDVAPCPMGIDVRGLTVKKNDPEVHEWIQVLKQRYQGMKLLVGRDKLDSIQGVKQKLLSFELFLSQYPQYQGKVVLIQVALQTTESNELAASVADLVSRINSRFSTLTYQPVVFLHTGDLTFSMYVALMRVADAFVVTSLREGMALRTHEFVECQEGRWRPLILSEFTGSYSYSGFRSCIGINPWDTRGVANAIYQALTMSDEEAKSRWEDLHAHVTAQTAQAFVTNFLNRCIRSNTEHTAALEETPLDAVPLLNGDMGNGSTGLSMVIPRFRHSKRRVVLVDLEGTLWRRDLTRGGLVKMLEGEGGERGLDGGGFFGSGGSHGGSHEHTSEQSGDAVEAAKEAIECESKEVEYKTKLPEEVEEVVKILQKLTDDERNEVWLLTGLRVRGVVEGIGERVPRIGIVAENGCFIKTRAVVANNGRTVGGEWVSMVANSNPGWKGPCLEILNYFTERTPGSFIEEREASMVWRFWTGSQSSSDLDLVSSDPSSPSGDIPPPSLSSASSSTSTSTNATAVPPLLSKSTSSLNINSTNHSSLTDHNHPDRQWALRQAAEAQNHIFDSLGERFGLRIIPGRNSFLVMPNNVSRSTAVGAILAPGGLSSGMGTGEGGGFGSSGFGGVPSSPIYGTGRSASGGHLGRPTRSFSMSADFSSSSHRDSALSDDLEFLLAISSDEKLLGRLNELDGAETVSTSGKGTDAKWRLRNEDVGGVLKGFVGV